jgi:hypothetical protein
MTLSDGKEILRLIHLVTRTPQSYRLLIICTPFISGGLINSLWGHKNTINVPILIITHPDTSRNIVKGYQKCYEKITIASISNLHAKVYLACGNDDKDSIAILGSFNFTMHALDTNIELGVRFSGKNPEFRRLITALENKLMAIAKINNHGERS